MSLQTLNKFTSLTFYAYLCLFPSHNHLDHRFYTLLVALLSQPESRAVLQAVCLGAGIPFLWFCRSCSPCLAESQAWRKISPQALTKEAAQEALFDTTPQPQNREDHEAALYDLLPVNKLLPKKYTQHMTRKNTFHL